MTDTVAVLGVGKMGEALLSGMVRAGKPVGQLYGSTRTGERAKTLEERYGVSMVSNADAVAAADTVLLAVTPQDITGVLDEIAPVLSSDTLVASLAAGVATDVIESHLPAGTPVVRVMPNTPAQVDEGMATLSAGRNAGDDQVERVAKLLSATGQVAIVPEKYQDAVTAISGTGPAYLFLVVESMIEAGVHLGLPRHTATQLAVQTMYGSAKLLKETGDHPTVLRERVTSPGGTTASAIRVLEDHKVRAAFLGAMEAARDRSRELADAARGDANPTDAQATGPGEDRAG